MNCALVTVPIEQECLKKSLWVIKNDSHKSKGFSWIYRRDVDILGYFSNDYSKSPRTAVYHIHKLTTTVL